MKKESIFYTGLFLLLFLPVVAFSQNTLVKWYATDFSSTKVEQKIQPSTMTAAGVSLTDQVWGIENIFYQTSNWPASVWNLTPEQTWDAGKYVQFTLKADSGYKINLESFNFWGRGNTDQGKIKIKYSTDASFAQATEILTEATSDSYKEYNLQFPAGTVVSDGETMYLRIYVYNTNQAFHIRHNHSGTIAPEFSGEVRLVTPVKPVVNNDRTGTLINTPITVDVLYNDDYRYSGPLTSLQINNAPAHGTVVVNGISDITYTPNNGYTGNDSFYYTVTNATGVSGLAKVELQIIQGSEQPLVRWNRASYSSTSYAASAIGGVMTAVDERLEVVKWEKDHFMLSELAKPEVYNGTADFSKYIQLSLASDLESVVYLNTLKMKYRSNGGTGNMSIEYSTVPDFSKDVFTLLGDTSYNASWVEGNLNFPPGVMLYPGQTLYVRIYTYNTNNQFLIDFTEGAASGPSFTGITAVYRPETVLATDEIKKDNIEVYKNGNAVIVKSNTGKITELQAFDASGRLVHSSKPNNAEASMDLSNFNRGVYILRVNQGGKYTAKKIIR